MVDQFAQASAGVKVAAVFAAWVAVWLPIAIPLAITLQWRPLKPLTVEQKLPLVASLYAIAPLILWGAAYLEHRPFSDYGLAWNWMLLAFTALGISLGVVGIAALFGLQQVFGWITWQQEHLAQFKTALFPTLLLGLWVSVTEELVFRGFLLNQLQDEYPLWIAAGFSSLIFALLHLVWEGRETVPQLPGLWLMGMVLVLARWANGGDLGLAIGLHAGWIWGIASLDTAQMIQSRNCGPVWMTGVANQPLAGAMGLLLLLITGGVVWAIGL
ncbi:MAG: CPBP family intramembrane metalloprotease [Leptolyngbyaceae cyanobacterium RU_5_1]|nr:CPBP family intramembrane metalloprotease [Leptolyngbyaceae cyanobacterium RU_5_1]